ncbi:efflux RND transporter periplasmic adaptor subunit [uncultured Desulfuromonas sp.]|uniref:efflux RND transporter periplasmic adaptor subunit n=1 Tax=uncultured Desulfuromonas sp. TaxID=181013 RepID=UPI002AABCE75|nr:efflux RND transporter periplasmic adaptor subunit [uncultured Desulfuromonas sp.]
MNWQRFFLMVGLLVLSGCGDTIEPGRSDLLDRGSVALPVMTLTDVVETSSESFVGTTESLDRAVLVARGSGQIDSFRVREGDRVTQGQLLVAVSDDPLRDQLAVAEAAYRAAETQAAAARARLTLAEQTTQRYQRLWANEAITAQEYDQVTAELEVARQQLAGAEAGLQQAAAARAAASRQSGFSRIHAPFAGQVLSLQARPGSTVLPGTPLLTLERSGQRQIRLSIPERLRGQIDVGTPLSLEIPALKQHFIAEVSRIQPGSDRDSRSFDALVLVAEHDDLPTGLFVRAHHQLPSEQLLLVPDRAVTRRGQLTGVFLVRDGRLHLRLVKLGRRFEDNWEVISGLQAGDRIVSEQVERAVDGARLEP